MAKEFKAEKSLVNYLSILGFNLKETQTESMYFVHKSGRQVRVNEENQSIAFLNPQGYKIKEVSSVTTDLLHKFSKGEDI